MKRSIAAIIILALMLFTGCSSSHRIETAAVIGNAKDGNRRFVL